MYGGTPVSFDGFDLQTANILTQTIAHETSADKIANDYDIAHANRNVIPYVGYTRRTITLMGTLVPSTPGDIIETDQLIDTFKSYFNGVNARLDIGYAGTTRRYIGTPSPDPIIDRPRGLASSTFRVSIVCQPFGMDTTPTVALHQTGRTGASYVDSFILNGTATLDLA